MSELQTINQGAVAPVQEAVPSSPMALIHHAMKTGSTIVEIRELWELQKDWEAHEARKAYIAAMAGFKSEAIVILKNKEVGYWGKAKPNEAAKFIGYKHAELADVTREVIPALSRHGLSHGWVPRQADGRIYVTCRITHVQGHSEEVTLDGPPDSSGNKNPMQQVASTITLLERYTLLAITGLATQGQDDDGRAGGAGDGEPRDQFRLEEWLGKADTAPDLAELGEVMEQGKAVIKARKDPDAWDKFKNAILRRKAELEAPAQREPGEEG